MHPHPFLKPLFAKAKRKNALIVLSEAEDVRVLKATAIIERGGFAKLVLIGNKKKIATLAKKSGIRFKSPVVDPKTFRADFSEELYNLRKGKITKAQAKKLVHEPHYFSALLVKNGMADGMVSGNLSRTADTLRAGLHVFGIKPRVKAFSYFMMLNPKEKQPIFYADCAFNITPNHKLLAEIAEQTAKEAKYYGVKPKVAMLSYSTHDSGGGAPAENVRKAVALAKKRKIAVDELQYDAAVVPHIGKHKSPGSKVAGKANVFIFPDLMSANIGYKIAERVGGWHAIGPLIWGLKFSMNDLSRGCSVDDIIAVVGLTALHSK